jgi:hypothetical protein
MRDDRPERERYRRASIREQLTGELRSFWATKPLVALVAFIVGGWLILTVTRPESLTVGRLAAGDCLYIRAADADTDPGGGRAIGTEAAAVTALYEQGAERASCDASHSHEVADAWVLDDPLVAAYPGQAALASRELPRCEAAFQALVGRRSNGSSLALVVAVPPERAWTERHARSAACLVADAAGAFLSSPVRGSAR